MSIIVDSRNLDFILFEMLNLTDILNSEQFAHCDRAVVTQILDSAQRLAEDLYLPSAARLDASPPEFVNGGVEIMPEVQTALAAYAEAGLSAQAFDHALGGLQLPFSVSMAANGMFTAANLGISNYSMLTTAGAHLLAAFGTEEQKARYAVPLIEGRWSGTMCLSEPQAGSSLSDITTRAEPAGDGTYRISGTKMWISGAAHHMTENIVNLVLAKIPGGPAGVKGISLFIVPQRLVAEDGTVGEENNITLVGLNHKMGQRGTTNCLLNFGETGPTVGYLIGEPHRGLHYMFHMMNEARISVGHGATMSGLAGYLYSRNYARERLQGRRIGQKDPQSPQVPLVEHADIRRMLLAQKAQVEGALALCSYCGLLVDQQALADGNERDDLTLLLEVLTPIAKSWPSEHCLEANKLAIQILGGAGYTLDHPVERFYRDNRLNHIHEGAYGIQGIDLLGRKVRMAGGRGRDLLVARITETIEQASVVPALADFARQLTTALEAFQRATDASLACDNQERALANATLYLDATGTVVVGWLWLWQALVAARALETGDAAPSAFYEMKITTCRYFFRYVLPLVHTGFALVEELDDVCLSWTPEQLEFV
ncbi:acyl-CoA dehydrogenase C-terminal domain-containing protein [Sphingobium subterraneum]|uniref:Butyryl-CoA dehydrogenase n=1 Tax=Sphingobium subterraneum TaxID=627688 RepID=A0A841J273_9SPHN|nr:butyryl-CoA dehydrogenase [Sphingobium subterraneum]